MKKLVYLFPAMMALGMPACGDDSSGTGGTDGGESSTGDAPTTSASDTNPDPTTGPGTTSTDPTVDPGTGDSSGGGNTCDADDECGFGDNACDKGFSCIACFCVEDDPNDVCPGGWNNEGAYADCDAGEECGGGDLNVACAGGPNDSSVCLFLGCEELCDCPAPPEGFETLARCEDQFGPGGNTDDINDCFLDCSGGEACPDGMFCGQGVCYAGDDPGAIPEYGDCLNNEGTCEDMGQCLSDGATFGACATNGCTDASDCSDAPDTGTAEPTCTTLPDDSSICTLGCSDDETCPDGMICLALSLGDDDIGSHCMWPVPEAPEVGFDDCANNPDSICLEGEVCVSDDVADPATAVCAQTGCTDPTTDCRDLPPGGDAVAACAEIDDTSDGEECVIDCSGGETCPTGMACAAAGYCTWEESGMVLLEDFSPGQLPGGWEVVDADGQVPAAQVSYINQAWTVSDTIVPDNPAIYSTSFYTPAGTADDWLVSPTVTLSATSVLTWDGRASDADFPDGYEVYVVDAADVELTAFLGSADPMDFLMAHDPVLTIAAEESMFTERTVSAAAGEPLEGLVGSDVRVLWRNNSTDQFVLLLDNISVSE